MKSPTDKATRHRAARNLLETVARLFPAVRAGDIVKSLRHMIRLQNSIEGRCCGDVGDRLTQYCAWIQYLRDCPDRVKPIGLEIGTLFGGGCLLMLNALRDEKRDGLMTCIDPMTGYYDKPADESGIPVSSDTFFRNLANQGFKATAVELRCHTSQMPEARAGLPPQSAAVILIDGDHTAEGVRHDWEDYCSYAAEGGFVLFDDYSDPSWPDVTKVVDALVAAPPDGWVALGQLGTTFVFRRSGGVATRRRHRAVRRESVEAVAALLELFAAAEQSRALTIVVRRRDRDLGQLTEQLAARNRDVGQLNEQVAGQERETAQSKALLADRDRDLAQVRNQVSERDSALAQLKVQLAERDGALGQLKGQVVERDSTLGQLKPQITARDGALSQLKTQVAERDSALGQLKTQLAARDGALSQLKTQVAERDSALGQLKTQLAARDNDNARLKDQLAGQERNAARLAELAGNRDRALAESGAFIGRLRADLSSLTSAYLIARWSQLTAAEGLNRVYLFGAGKHTDWFLDVVRGHPGPQILGILDDKAVSGETRGGYPVLRPEEARGGTCDAIILSTDTFQGSLRHRCHELFRDGIRTVDLYGDLPPERLTFAKMSATRPLCAAPPLRVNPAATEGGDRRDPRPAARAA